MTDALRTLVEVTNMMAGIPDPAGYIRLLKQAGSVDVGPTKTMAIFANAPFTHPDELLEVQGIGEKIRANIADSLMANLQQANMDFSLPMTRFGLQRVLATLIMADQQLTASTGFTKEAIWNTMRDIGGLEVDKTTFNPLTGVGFTFDMDKFKAWAGMVQTVLVKEEDFVFPINDFCIRLRLGVNGARRGENGGSASLIEPNLSNCFIIAIGGNGANGVVDFFSKGRGGNGGDCTIVVNQSNLIIALAGNGGNGGVGRSFPGGNLTGGTGGEGGRGGNITLVSQGNNVVGLLSGQGGEGGIGGQGGARLGFTTGDGGQAGKGGDSGSVALSALQTDFGKATSGNGGKGGMGGAGTSRNPLGPAAPVASGGNGGNGGKAGNIVGSTSTGIGCSVGSPGAGGAKGLPAPLTAPINIAKDGVTGAMGQCS